MSNTRYCIICGEAFSSGDAQESFCELHRTPHPVQSPPPLPGVSPELVAVPGSTKKNGIWQLGQVILDTYEVKGILGKGGFGQVYRVHHKGWNMDLAVKRALNLDQQGKQAFIDEAQKWIDLGLHPHIISCYYVRNIDGFPHTFAELAEGGSLESWIQRGRYDLYAGDPQSVLARILDIAIQFAWGLGYAHEQGLVHQDVKPQNALMTPDGILKVTDFGLARARGNPATGTSPAPGGDNLVSGAGYTLAYRSPEQAEGRKLSLATDIWSWAVSVLEMFNGGISWLDGQGAAATLQSCQQHAGEDEDIPPMPANLADLLRECFQEDPKRRPKDLNTLASELASIYHQQTGYLYPREVTAAAKLRADSLNNKALSWLDLGQTASACQAWDKALELDPHHLESTYNRGLWLWRCGQQPDDLELVHQLDLLADADPLNWEVRLLLAQVHSERLDLPEAQKALDQAQQILPSSPEVQSALADLVGAQGTGCVYSYDLLDSPDEVLAFTPDGKLLIGGEAAGQDDSEVSISHDSLLLWDISEEDVRATRAGQPGKINTLCMSANGQYVYILEEDGNLYSWDLRHGDCIWRSQVGNNTTGWLALAEPEGALITMTTQGQLRVWQAADGKNLLSYQSKIVLVTAMAVTHVLGTLSILTIGLIKENDSIPKRATATELFDWDDQHGVIFHLTPWEEPSALLGFNRWPNTEEQVRDVFGPGVLPHGLSISPNGEYAFIGHENHKVYLIPLVRYSNERANAPDFRTYAGHREAVSKTLALPDNKHFLSAGEDRTIRLWEIGKPSEAKLLTGHTSAILHLLASQDGRLAISGSADQTLRVWDLQTGRCLRTMHGHQGAIGSIALTTDGSLAASTGHDHTLRLWRLDGLGERLAPWQLCLPEQAVRALETSHAAERGIETARQALAQAHAGEAGRILEQVRQLPGFENDPQVLDLQHQAGQRAGLRRGLQGSFSRWQFANPRSKLTCLALSPDGAWLAAAYHNKVTLVWNMANGRLQNEFQAWSEVTALAFAPGGRLLIGSKEKTVSVYALDSRKLERRLEGHRGRLLVIHPTADGQRVLTMAGDPTVRLWDLATGECLAVFKHQRQVSALTLGWEEQLLLTTDLSGELIAWDMEQGIKRATLCQQGLELYAVGISTDGKLAAAGGVDGKVRGWEIQTHGENAAVCQFILDNHPGTINQLTFLPDGERLLVGSLSGDDISQFHLWDFRNKKLLHTFPDYHQLRLTPDGRFGIGVDFQGRLPVWDFSAPDQPPRPCIPVEAAHQWEKHQFWGLTMTPDARCIAARDGEKGAMAWKLSWEYGFPAEVDWDESVRPFLQAFLQQRWLAWQSKTHLEDEDKIDFQLLQEHLGLHGLGWLAPNGVRREAEAVWHVLHQTAHSISPGLTGTQAVDKQFELARQALLEHQGEKAYALLRSLQEEAAFEKDLGIQELLAQCGRYGRRIALREAWPLLEKKARKSRYNTFLRSATLSPDGTKALITADEDAFVQLWDLPNGSSQHILSAEYSVVRFSPDGKNALAGSDHLILFSTSHHLDYMRFETPYICMNAACFSPDGNYILTGHMDHSLCYWGWDGYLRSCRGHSDHVVAVAFSPDGELAYSGSDDHLIKCWELANGECLYTLSDVNQGMVKSLAISPDGQYCVSGNYDTLSIWNTQTRALEKELVKIMAHIFSMDYAADGYCLATGNSDGAVMLWRMPEGKLIIRLDQYDGMTISVNFSRCGRLLLTAGSESRFRLWNLDWEWEFPAVASWDEGARPYLQAFLTLHTPRPTRWPTSHSPTETEQNQTLTRQGKPTWSEADFAELLLELGYRGYGWLKPEGVRHKLEEMARERS